MSKQHGTSRVAFALAVGVAVSITLLAGSILYSIIDKNQELSAEATNLMSAVLGGAVGALATYLGQGDKGEESYEQGYQDGLDAWPGEPSDAPNAWTDPDRHLEP